MKKSNLIVLSVCVVALLFGSVGLGDWNPEDPAKYIQMPDLTRLGVDVCVDDTGYGGRRVIGDDFPCYESGSITDVHLWCSWKDDIPGEITGITLSFWSDNPQGSQGYSEPDMMLWQKQFVPGDFTMRLYYTMPDETWEGWWDPRSGFGYIPQGDTQVWQINMYMDSSEAFFQEGTPDFPVTYWLVVEVQLADGSQANLGWKTRDRWDGHYNDDAVWYTPTEIPWHDLKYPQGHEYYPDSMDMAFVITTGEEPVPEKELGDAPDSSNSYGTAMTAYPDGTVAKYPTVYGMGSPPYGPLHHQPASVAYLGQNVTLENEADIGPDQDGVNNIDPPSDAPDQDMADDGVQIPLLLPHCQTTTFDYTVTIVPMAAVPPDLYVNVWFDWNGDGDWDDTMDCGSGDPVIPVPEWAVQNQQISGMLPGQYTITSDPFMCWHPSGSEEPNDIWMRITISEQRWSSGGTAGYGGAGPTNGYLYGETEDYYFQPDVPQEPDLEYGDAPEAGVAYPSSGVLGQFPTCITVGPPTSYIQHGLCWAHFGTGFDFELDGNAGLCPTCFPSYDQDECFQDGDAGLIAPEPYTIQGGAVAPCPPLNGSALGQVCQTAVWGNNIDIYVENFMPVDGFINVLIDWDQNGMWAGSSSCVTAATAEHVLQNWPVPQNYVGPLSGLLPPDFLIGPNSGYVWARFSVTESPVPADWDGSGVYEDGETEDYLLRVDSYVPPPKLDFGDAPEAPYPTKLASDGARHVIVQGYCLGTTIDDEGDGQPTANADGDDNDTQGDDEDGVTFITSPLIPGQWSIIDVTNSIGLGGTGYLDGWLDLNGDGDWADPGEQILNSYSLSPLGFDSIWYQVPLTAVPNITTYARFRLSSTGGLSYTGQAGDGEVEDYEVRIGENPNVKWIQLPDFTQNGIDIRVDSSDGIMRTLADDFECTGFGPITDVHLWGSWKNDEKGEIIRLHLSIHSDDPAGPGGSDPDNNYSRPDELLWEKDFYPGEFTETLVTVRGGEPEFWWDPARGDLIAGGDSLIWRIDADIHPREAFLQEGSPENPVVYWLDVQAETVNGQLGWKTREWPRHYNDDATMTAGELPPIWEELRYSQGHPYHGLEDDSIDMAFAITGTILKHPAEHLKWSQPPIEMDPWSLMPTYCGWDEPSFGLMPAGAEPFWRIAADDFRCIGNIPVTSVHWWGSYQGWEGREPPATKPSGWVLGFFSNVAADPDGDPNFSYPSELLWVVDIPAGSVNEEWVGSDYFPDRLPETCFQYYVDLEPNNWFRQGDFLDKTEDKVFWLGIAAVYGDGVDPQFTWGWKTRPWHWMDDAVTFEIQGNPEAGAAVLPPDIMTPIENRQVCQQLESYDLAFELDTDPNYIKWEQPFTGIQYWHHYEDVKSMATEETISTVVVKYDEQYPDLSELGIDVDATAEDFGGWLPQVLADDYPCDKTGPVTEISIWGSWYHDLLPMQDPTAVMFTLRIHSDIPANESPTGYSMPGDILWQKQFQPGEFGMMLEADGLFEGYYVPCVDVYEHPGDSVCWRYDFAIDPCEAFMQTGTPDRQIVYWLSVEAIPMEPGQVEPIRFGWKTSMVNWNDDAVWAVAGAAPVSWNELRYPAGHPRQGESMDLAFMIITTEETEVLTIDNLVADDWLCEEKSAVTSLAWWGSYIDYRYLPCQCNTAVKPEEPDYFLLSVWTDVPASVSGDYSHPGENIWQYKAEKYNEVLVGFDKHPEDSGDPGITGFEPVFRYSVQLPRDKWFIQEDENTVYWLSVVAVYKDPERIRYPWGWTNHEHYYNDDAVVGHFEPGVEPVWDELYDQTGESEDMSFVLYTECYPCCPQDYNEWLAVGRPLCWCYPRQCHGDADGQQEKIGVLWYSVAYNDLNILVGGWKQRDASLPGICADFDHAPEKIGILWYRVGYNDLNILIQYWKDRNIPEDCLICP